MIETRQAYLDPDQDRAGEKYEEIRRKLMIHSITSFSRLSAICVTRQSQSYFVGFGVFTTGSPVSGTLTDSIAGTSPSGGGTSQVLNTSYSLQAVPTTTLFSGDYVYQITVPQGATRLEVHNAAGSNAEVHLYLRYGQDVDLDNSGHVSN